MLNTLEFLPRPGESCPRVLGVLVSQAPLDHAVSFSVPAHVMLTLNHVKNGQLSVEGAALPASFATGAQRRSHRYHISAGALLITLFCRADALGDVSGLAASQVVDQWVDAMKVFGAWQEPSPDMPYAAVAEAMLSCVAPEHLPPRIAGSKADKADQIEEIVQLLAQHDLPRVATSLGLSERSLQRLFAAQWGMGPKLVQRMLRIQKAVQLWEANEPRQDLADLAAQLGLADQAHLAREFRQLVGYPPHALRVESAAQDKPNQDDVLWALRTGNRLLMPFLLAPLLGSP